MEIIKSPLPSGELRVVSQASLPLHQHTRAAELPKRTSNPQTHRKLFKRSKLSTSIGMALVALSSSAYGANFNWTNAFAGDSLYQTAGNWNPGGPPGAADTAIFDLPIFDVVYFNGATGARTLDRIESLNDVTRLEKLGGVASLNVVDQIRVDSDAFFSISALPVTTDHVLVGDAANARMIVEMGFADPLTGGSLNSNLVTVGAQASGNGNARINGSASVWTNSGTARIGRLGTGSLLIEAGGTMNNGTGIVGELSGSNGNATVTGANSTWTNSSGLDVARLGTGTLTIEDGGFVSTNNIFVARQTSSDGTINVTGTDSLLDVSALLGVGRANFGAGKLNITSGGTVNSFRSNLANNTGGGTAAVVVGDGVGTSTWSNSTTLNVGGDDSSAGGTASLTINDGGVVNNGSMTTVWGPGTIDTTGGGTLRSDSLTVVNGGTVTATASIIDAPLVATGQGQVVVDIATVTGANSTWTNTNAMVVGRNAIGALRIENGGEVASATGLVGELDSGDGTVTVTGANSRWSNSGVLDVGRRGAAILNIEDGGVASANLVHIARQTNSVGTVTVTGTDSSFDVAGGLEVGRANFGSGTLNILSGGAVNSGSSNIANNSANGTGVVNVGDGVGTSTWTNTGNLNVGGNDVSAGGSGALNVNAGGEVDVGGTLKVWDTASLNGGMIKAQSFDADGGTFNFNHGSVVVDGGSYQNNGSLFSGSCGGPCVNRTLTLDGGATANFAGAVALGAFFDNAEETVNVLDGSVMTTGPGVSTIRFFTGPSSATVNVDGASSTWTNNGSLIVGDSGLVGGGSLRSANGGLVEIAEALTVRESGRLQLAGGTITADTIATDGLVDGFGTVQGIYSGSASSSLHAQGGTLNIGDASRFQSFNTMGTVTVDAGATLNLSSLVNFNRLGPVTQLNGGIITSNTGVVVDAGRVVNGHGEIDTRVAAGVGSSIVADGTLALGKHDAFDGYYSDGELIVGNHEVTLNDRDEAVVGSLTSIGNAIGAGTLNATNGLLVEFGKTISGYGTVNGDILNNGLINGEGPGMFDFLDLQGVVSGVGDFDGTVQFSGGFTPGLSPTITNGTNLIFNSSLEMEIGGLTPGEEHDQIIATGFVLLAGELDIVLINSWVPSIDDVYTLILANEIFFDEGFEPGFANINYPDLEPGLRFLLDFNLDPNGVDSLELRVAAVPIPGAVWLLLSAVPVFMRRTSSAV